MAIAYIALGSNLGESLENCRQALGLLASPQIQVVEVSSFYRTPAEGYTDQPDFINAVARLETSLSPQELFAAMQGVEKELGKAVPFRWGPRSIDLDLLLYADLVIQEV